MSSFDITRRSLDPGDPAESLADRAARLTDQGLSQEEAEAVVRATEPCHRSDPHPAHGWTGALGAVRYQCPGLTVDAFRRGGLQPKPFTATADGEVRMAKQIERQRKEIERLTAEYDTLATAVTEHAPECWEDEDPPEGVAVAYVRSLENWTDPSDKGHAPGCRCFEGAEL